MNLLRGEVAQLKSLLLAHKDCPIFTQQTESGQISLESGVPGSGKSNKFKCLLVFRKERPTLGDEPKPHIEANKEIRQI